MHLVLWWGDSPFHSKRVFRISDLTGVHSTRLLINSRFYSRFLLNSDISILRIQYCTDTIRTIYISLYYSDC